jgi:diguanylate cyclase (GGDEF)-like protein
MATGDRRDENPGMAVPALMDSGALPIGTTMSGRVWRIYLAGGVAAVVLYFLLPLDGLWSNVVYDLIGLSSSMAMLVAVRRHRPARPLIWWCFAAGQLLFVVGDVLYAVIDQILHQSPFPSVADGFYLGGYPVLAAGLLVLIRGRISGRDRAGLIDAAIIATGLGLLSWTFVMKPIAADPSLSLPERLISLAYPLGDVLLLAMAARLATSPGARTVAYRLLGVALVLLLGADIGYAVLNLVSSYEGGLIDAGWLLSYVVWGTAALHPSMRSLSEVAPDRAVRFSHWRLGLLATTSLMAPAVLAEQGLGEQPIDVAAIVLGSVVLFLLVVLRMAGLVAKVQDQASQLAALAHNDGLTGIPNRRAWELELPREMARVRRYGGRLYVALLDLDHFKRYNDHHGHQGGDRLLKEATAAWQTRMRRTDLLARYGGEEFAVLLRDCTHIQAAVVLDDLRAVTPDSQTFSAGLAEWDGHEDPERLVGQADRALYEAKHAGRDRIIAATAPSDHPEQTTDETRPEASRESPQTHTNTH